MIAQRSAILAEAERRGWPIEVLSETKGASSATLARPALTQALHRLDRGEAQVLIVAKLDRLSRSVTQGSEIIERAGRKGWSLVALDFGLDTTTPAGEMVAKVILSASQYERRMIGQRTREGLAAKRAQGVRLGRPAQLPIEVVGRVVRERRDGATFAAIAEGLNRNSIPTAQGGVRWYSATVRAVFNGQAAAAIQAGESLRKAR